MPPVSGANVCSRLGKIYEIMYNRGDIGQEYNVVFCTLFQLTM